MRESCLKTLTIGTGGNARPIAVRIREGKGPGLFWLGGFKSDMKGTKAEALDRWLEESVVVFTQESKGPQIVIGSSMGGWLALLMARALKDKKGAPPIAGM